MALEEPGCHVQAAEGQCLFQEVLVGHQLHAEPEELECLGLEVQVVLPFLVEQELRLYLEAEVGLHDQVVLGVHHGLEEGEGPR